MSITKSIVEHVQTQLSPPGRFLEKDQASGNWKEVDTKRAHEKTAQALRDGAAPLRKRLSDEITSDPLFLLNVFEKVDEDRSAQKSCNLVSAEHLHLIPPNKRKKEQVQEKSMNAGIPPSMFSSTSVDPGPGLSAREVSLISPNPSPAASVTEFDLSFRLVGSKGDEFPIDVVDMLDDEILELWDAF